MNVDPATLSDAALISYATDEEKAAINEGRLQREELRARLAADWARSPQFVLERPRPVIAPDPNAPRNMFGGLNVKSEGGRRYSRSKHKNQISAKVARHLYRTRVRRTVSQAQRDRMRALGQKWGPVLREARAIARRAGRGRITKSDYAAARRAMGM